MKKLKLALLILAVLVLAAFAPAFSQSATAIICRFESTACVTSWNGADIVIYSDNGSTQKFLVDGATGDVTAAGTLSTTGAQTQTGLLNANGGIAVDTTAFRVADTTGNTIISGTLGVTGATALTGTLSANGGITADTTAFAVADTTGNTTISGTLTVTSTSSLKDDLDMNAQPILNIGNAGTDFGTDGSLTTAAGITLTTGAVAIGSDYALSTDATDMQWSCGITDVLATAFIPTGLTTATYATGQLTTTPLTTSYIVQVPQPTTSSLRINVWGATSTPTTDMSIITGTTNVSVTWCALGNK